MWTKYLGWLRVAPIWVGFMSGGISILREAVVTFSDHPDPIWQRNVFWSCVWVAFVISMFAWVYQKERDLRTERGRHGYPDIRGKIEKVFFDGGQHYDEIWELNQFFITVKIRLENHGAESNVSDFALDINADKGTYISIKSDMEGLYFVPDPQFDSSTKIENLSDISTRETEKFLVRGKAEWWWFRGKLPVQDLGATERLKPDDVKEIVFWVTDGFGKRHPIKAVRPWNQTGRLDRKMLRPINF